MFVFYGALLMPIVFYDYMLEKLSAIHLVGFYGLMIGILILMIQIGKFRSRKAGLYCTHCDSTLSRPGIEIAIATGNCGSCGKTFLED